MVFPRSVWSLSLIPRGDSIQPLYPLVRVRVCSISCHLLSSCRHLRSLQTFVKLKRTRPKTMKTSPKRLETANHRPYAKTVKPLLFRLETAKLSQRRLKTTNRQSLHSPPTAKRLLRWNILEKICLSLETFNKKVDILNYLLKIDDRLYPCDRWHVAFPWDIWHIVPPCDRWHKISLG